jgi:hypothetical protein
MFVFAIAQPLAETFLFLRQRKLAVGLMLSETWLREYQVEPMPTTTYRDLR